MRRKDREIKDLDEIVRIMERCEVCRLALHDGDYPYIVPVNFGVVCEGGDVTLYFHGANQGKKWDLIQKDGRAGFEMDGAHCLHIESEACKSTMEYESVVGRGRIKLVPEEEKEQALLVLMRHYGEKEYTMSRAVVEKTAVWKLTVEKVTGKAHRKER